MNEDKLFDLIRDLEKIEEAVTTALEHHKLQNEANAKLHCSDTVLYSPLTVKLATAKQVARAQLDRLRSDLPAGVIDRLRELREIEEELKQP